MSQAIQAALMAYVDDINTQGGIYQRRITLLFDTSPEAAGARLQAARTFLEASQVFALLGSFIAGAEADMATLMAEQDVPVVGAFALYPQVRFPLNRHVFYLSTGLQGQGQVLLTFVAHRYTMAKPPLAILSPDEPMAREVAETLGQHCQTLGWGAVEQMRVPRRPLNVALLVQALRAQGTEIMLVLDPRIATSTFFQEAHKQAWHPLILIPGALAERELLQAPTSFEGRIFLAFPTLPTAYTPGDMHAYRRLATTHKLSPQHLTAQLSALSSAQLLVEGLKRAGREVSRQKLIEALEGLYEFHTGFSLALTYSPNRRIGALGTHIVTLDLGAQAFVPVGTALAPN